eukprot:PLAT4066.1.p1 GENE.PLAT4066.1~~PLAT4066.1.p1  ORF type:complete len:308 (+),score=136.44 PLAT4066.1:261-1184(+)
MDCSVVATRFPDLYLVSTTDFFYPLIDDPYLQGRIAACNVLSDLYAMGVRDVDTVLMLLAVSRKMTRRQQDVVTTLLIKGFTDTCAEAGTSVTGGQTVLNPWPIIGGEASAMCRGDEFIRPVAAVPGDVIVLTKPLGTQVAVNAHQWLREPRSWAAISDAISKDDVLAAYAAASASMAELNRTAAVLMHEHGAHGATDVTGFGVLGHASNLAESQSAAVSLRLHTLPILAGMCAVEAAKGGMFRLLQGFSAETSGGLLICLPAEQAEPFCAAFEAAAGHPAWIVGDVIDGSNDAMLVSEEELKVVEV